MKNATINNNRERRIADAQMSSSEQTCSSRKKLTMKRTILVSVYTLAAVLPVSAQLPSAFVWNDRARGTGYANGYYQFNSSLAANYVTNLSTGKYRVDLPGLGVAGGTVHVSAYNGNHYCKPQQWFPNGTTMQVLVNCFAPSGAFTNGLFTILFYKQSGESSVNGAYLWADNPTAASYTPSTAYQWSSALRANTVNRTGPGVYQALLPGLTSSGGTVLVTSYGSGSERCKIASWFPSNLGIAVNVSCFQVNGNPADTQFTLSFLTDPLIGGAFAWADQPYVATYTPSAAYQHSSTGSTITVSRTSVGSYKINIPSQPPYNKTGAFVTAYGTTSEYCNIVNWLPSGANNFDTAIDVACYDRYGSVVDTRYTVLYTTDRPPYVFATSSLNCGQQIVTVSTGNGSGKCTKVTNNGKDQSMTCSDDDGNNASTAACSGTSGSCGESIGSGSCTISK